MRTMAIAATIVIGLIVPDLAPAQGKAPSGGMGGHPAPVGHRQPGAKDVPRDQGYQPGQPGQPSDTIEMSKEDRALDRALKNICRGC
jgi:hypothetical protein